MLIEFAVTNFRSFRERQVFSLLPAGKIKAREISLLELENYPEVKTLRSAVIYGPNNAGKSNFLRAISALEWLVRNSGNFNSDRKLDANEYFQFDIQMKDQPTIFEIDFIAPNKNRYRYEVAFNSETILKEKLNVFNISKTGKTTNSTLFEREAGKQIRFPNLKGAKESVTFQENQLFLSRGDIAGNPELKEVYSFFSKHLYVFQLTETDYTNFLINEYARFIVDEKGKNNKKIHGLIEIILRRTNTGISGIHTDLTDLSGIRFPDDTSQEIKDKIFNQLKYEIKAKHPSFDGNKEIGETFIAFKEESTGTRKLLGIAQLIINALVNGDTLFIDEMNTSMHTEITSWLIDLFNDPESNPNNAQLIITTHDIILIHRHLYERDQIFIAQKNEIGVTELYSFSDIKNLRNKNLVDYYETGRLGGIPNVSKAFLKHSFSKFIKNAEIES